MWLVACKGKQPYTLSTSYATEDGCGEEWLPKKQVSRFDSAWTGVIYPTNKFGAKLLRPDGSPYRKQEMPFNVVAHAMAVHTKPEWRILDPFGGTGVTAMCGIRMRRPVTCIEKFADTEDDAKRRLKRYYLWCQTKLTAKDTGPTKAEVGNPYKWYAPFCLLDFFLITILPLQEPTNGVSR
jgi:hypothetical protein